MVSAREGLRSDLSEPEFQAPAKELSGGRRHPLLETKTGPDFLQHSRCQAENLRAATAGSSDQPFALAAVQP